MARLVESEIVGTQPGLAGDPGEHTRTDLFAIMEREDEVRPVRPFQDAMRTSALSFDAPADPEQRR